MFFLKDTLHYSCKHALTSHSPSAPATTHLHTQDQLADFISRRVSSASTSLACKHLMTGWSALAWSLKVPNIWFHRPRPSRVPQVGPAGCCDYVVWITTMFTYFQPNGIQDFKLSREWCAFDLLCHRLWPSHLLMIQAVTYSLLLAAVPSPQLILPIDLVGIINPYLRTYPAYWWPLTSCYRRPSNLNHLETYFGYFLNNMRSMSKPRVCRLSLLRSFWCHGTARGRTPHLWSLTILYSIFKFLPRIFF